MDYFTNKLSRYTLITRLNLNKTLLYNTRTNAILVVENDVAERFNNRKWSLSEQERWIAGGFILDDGFDEREEIFSRYSAAKDNENLALVICPTLGCNLKCGYCYEETQHEIEFMSDSVANEIVSFVEKGNYRSLAITWYGGEPLLAVSRIKDLQSRLKKITNIVTSSIITNGVLLTQNVYESLKSSGVERYQITLDGSKATHDQRRITHSGDGSFDKIIANIRNINFEPANLSLRVNIDKTNMNSYYALLEFFKSDDTLRKYIEVIYPAQVTAWPSLPDKWKENCLSKDEYSTFYFELADKIYEKYGVNLVRIPESKNMFCGTSARNSFVIGPKGELYKCWINVGNPKSVVGDISVNGKDICANSKEKLFWEQWNPKGNKVCFDCQFLPICMGGCAGLTHIAQKEQGEQCIPMKDYYLETILRAYRGNLNDSNTSSYL